MHGGQFRPIIGRYQDELPGVEGEPDFPNFTPEPAQLGDGQESYTNRESCWLTVNTWLYSVCRTSLGTRLVV